MSNETRPCTGCEQPTADTITVAGIRLPYHPQCAAEARLEAQAIMCRMADALCRMADTPAPCRVFQADEI
jgi:hypothetical protein